MALRPPLVVHATIRYGVHHFAKKKSKKEGQSVQRKVLQHDGIFFNTKVSRFFFKRR